MQSQPTLLLVDDEARALTALLPMLTEAFEVKIATTAHAALQWLEEEWVQIVLCNQSLLKNFAAELLQQVQHKWPDVMRVLISGEEQQESIDTELQELGICQYIPRPWHPHTVRLSLNNALRLFELQRENELLNIELKMAPPQGELHRSRRPAFRDNDRLVRAADSPLNELYERIQNIAAYDISVLIHGESGTGKELAARALHDNSPRWDQPFVVENCGALPDELLESELFGYKRGAFTGALEDRIGLFERASGGTVFLDEIGEISPAFQVKLLRVLQEGEIRPLGGNNTRKVDLRVVAATNKNLEDEVQGGRFREDLYYRLSAMTITMPPLRERVNDIPVLARALLQKAIGKLGKAAQGFTEEALSCMQAYNWPGNVRELQNEVQQMLVLGHENLLGAELLSARVLRAISSQQEPSAQTVVMEGSLKQRVESLEVGILRETLIRHRWNKSRAARELGLSRVGLSSKLERYGLEKEDSVAGEQALG